MDDIDKIDALFQRGLQAYQDKDYFSAHDHWEELWSDYYLEDRLFIQALIQMAVSFVHLENGNLKGAKSLMDKSLKYTWCNLAPCLSVWQSEWYKDLRHDKSPN